MQILVADDDPVYRNLLQGLLEESHFEVVLSADGAEAWAILQRSHAPTFAIPDWMMPEMDGYEVCRKIRQAKDNSTPYILLMTSKGRREELLKLLIVRADDYPLKPFEPLELGIRLRTGIQILIFDEQFGPATIK